jgi:ferritin-like metal-binding protein YciE
VTGTCYARSFRPVTTRVEPQDERWIAREEAVVQVDTLRDLFVKELSDVYSAEKQLTKALPKMAKAASFRELQDAFSQHLKQTEGHVQRLEQVFDMIGEKPKRVKCKGMEGLVEEGSEMLKEEGDGAAIDAGLISAAQRVEHYEIAAYGTLRTYAETLGENDAAELLQETLDEESATNEKLTTLAESAINPTAAAGASKNGGRR